MSAATMNEMERLRKEREELSESYKHLLKRNEALAILLEEALEREAALAAQILTLADSLEEAEAPDAEAGDMWDASQCADWIREQAPISALTKRDLIKQAEALENEANGWPEDKYTECSHVRESILESANELRQQAQELTP